MTFQKQIEDLKKKLELVRTNKEHNLISNKILKLAKKYNTLNHKDEFVIIDNEVYGLIRRKNHKY